MKESGVSMTIHNYSVLKSNGEEQSLADYKGNLLLIVNTASQCGYTPQYEGLEKLYRKFKDQGFYVLSFPCNQFHGQESGNNQEIEQFCKVNYDITFPLFAKIDVNGKNAHPLYQSLKKQKRGLLFGRINWNFTKFLVGRDGRVIERYSPRTEPEDLEKEIIANL